MNGLSDSGQEHLREELTRVGGGASSSAPTASPMAIQSAAQTAAQLRAEFDHSFSLRLHESSGKARDFVIVQIAGHAYALAALALRGIERTGGVSDRGQSRTPDLEDQGDFHIASSNTFIPSQSQSVEWVQVPSTQPALLGLRAFSGRIVPVFALATLLGVEVATTSLLDATHCALVASGADLAGFAFDALLHFVRVEPEQIFAAGASAPPWQEATLAHAGEVYAVIGIAGIAARLRSSTVATSQPHVSKNQVVQDGKS